jgi:ABC-type transporter MlaC component
MIVSFITNAQCQDSIEAQKINYAQDIKDKLYNITNNTAIAEKERLDRVIDLIVNNMNVNRIAKSVLGRNWKQLSQEQKDQYLEEYPNFLKYNLKNNIEEVMFLPKKHIKLVKKIIMMNDIDHEVSFLVQRKDVNSYFILTIELNKDNTMKVVNISVDNIDLITSQALLLGGQIERQGIDCIVKFMKETYES